MLDDIPKLGLKNLISIAQLSTDDILGLLKTAERVKAKPRAFADALAQKRLVLMFEKESLRTRITFDVGIQDLGGSAVYMDQLQVRLGAREALRDVAKNLERWTHCIVARTYKHRTVVDLAEHASIPVINGLTNYLHPCQGLTDLFSLWER